MSGLFLALFPKVKNVAFTSSFFNKSNIRGVTVLDGPSSNVRKTLFSPVDLYMCSILSFSSSESGLLVFSILFSTHI